MPKPTTALVVDDEPHVRMFLRMLLKQLGVTTVWEASIGSQALELVAQHSPQVVLLDLNMPVMNGLEVLSTLSREYPGIPVLIVTSQNGMKTVLEARRLGAVGYVLKYGTKAEVLKGLAAAFEGLDDAG